MADNVEKKKDVRIRHYLSREQFNSLCSILKFIATDTNENRYSSFADYMLFKLIRYSVILKKDNVNTYLIQLFPNEVEMLLQIYIIFVAGYIRASDLTVKDYSSIAGSIKLGYKYDRKKNISKKVDEII